jgi:plastocyanin
MRTVSILLASLLLAGGGAAPAQEWRRAPEYDVLISSFDIEPELVRLEAGEAVRLRFVNNSRQTHIVSAPGLFGRARLRGRDAELREKGRLRLRPGEARSVALVPEPGRYRMTSTNLLRRLRGMNARILVE